jgi:hypothetical protein
MLIATVPGASKDAGKISVGDEVLFFARVSA